MIVEFSIGKKNIADQQFVYSFVKQQRDQDFYLTENNQRIYIDNYHTFKKLVKGSTVGYVSENEDGDCFGLLLVWKSRGGDVVRNYVKIVAASPKEAEKLLTVLNWNFSKELYAKVSKGSPLLDVFRSKGFRFEGGRGRQILLKRGSFNPKLRITRGTEEDDGNNSDRHRN